MITVSVRTTDSKGNEKKVATYRSQYIPRVGEMLDFNHGNYRVLEVWHDILGDSQGAEGRGTQEFVRVFVGRTGKRPLEGK